MVPFFYGITTAQFTAGLDELLAAHFAPTTNLKTYLTGAVGHVLWFMPALGSTATVKEFVTQMVTDDAAWASVPP